MVTKTRFVPKPQPKKHTPPPAPKKYEPEIAEPVLVPVPEPIPTPPPAPMPEPTPPPPPAPEVKVAQVREIRKIGDLTFEIAKQPNSENFRIFHESGASSPVNDLNTILLWEILKVLSK